MAAGSLKCCVTTLLSHQRHFLLPPHTQTQTVTASPTICLLSMDVTTFSSLWFKNFVKNHTRLLFLCFIPCHIFKMLLLRNSLPSLSFLCLSPSLFDESCYVRIWGYAIILQVTKISLKALRCCQK